MQLLSKLSDPRYVFFHLQRRFMKPGVRNMLGSWVARFIPRSDRKTSGSPSSCETDLTTTGIHMLGQILSAAQCQELVEYFSTKQVFDHYRTDHPAFLPHSDQRHPDAHVANHQPGDVLKAPYLFELANDPNILNALEGMFGCKPTIGNIAAWWSYQTSIEAQHAELFHRDVDDLKFIKLFVYLTDVDTKNGPHIYVKGSANSDELCQIGRFHEDEVTRIFGKENIVVVEGKSGTAFIENTFGIHRGQPVTSGIRLLFQVLYCLTPLPYSPKAPVVSPSEVAKIPYDAWINRLYVSS